jgi:transcriptional regulator with GAF, ATPase, and Fis domain
MQAVLLRFLESGEIQRVGADRSTGRVNVRLITATNRDLQAGIAAGTFREDLYFRLNVIRLVIPPLRERAEDIPLLVDYYAKLYSEAHRTPLLEVLPEAMEALLAYRWPGNIRELKNVIERAVILSRGKVLRLDLAMSDILNAPAVQDDATGTDSSQLLTEAALRELERQNIERALTLAAWRVSGPNGAAKLLGVKPTTLADRMKKFKIAKPRRRA